MIIIINKIKINTNLLSGKQIEKELCNISFYFSQTNSTKIPLKFPAVCDDVGEIVNTTETSTSATIELFLLQSITNCLERILDVTRNKRAYRFVIVQRYWTSMLK